MLINMQFASKNEGFFQDYISKLINDEFTCYGWMRSHREITELERMAVISAVEGITGTSNVATWEGKIAEIPMQAFPEDNNVDLNGDLGDDIFIVFGY